MDDKEKLLKMYYEFMADNSAKEMYITGMAGTGKTTILKHILSNIKLYALYNFYNQNGEEDTAEKPVAMCCAYTHKAKKILREKLALGKDLNKYVVTLHSFLGKVPAVNQNAKKDTEMDYNILLGEKDYDCLRVLFIDEFSMIGTKDYKDILDFQNEYNFKVVYIGDLNQLEPVKDKMAVCPKGKYHYKLTTIHRQSFGNKLIDNLEDLKSFISKEKPIKKLETHESYLKGKNIVEEYKKAKTNNKVILAWTNAAVQEYNARVEGRRMFKEGDNLHSPTLRTDLVVEKHYDKTDIDFILYYDLKSLSQYKGYRLNVTNDNSDAFMFLLSLPQVEFINITYINELTEKEENDNIATVFGHNNFKILVERSIKAAVRQNNNVIKLNNLNPDEDLPYWCKQSENINKPEVRARAQAWKEYFTITENLYCTDFQHALTVHKSQGSTYDTVCIDNNNLYKRADKNFEGYLRLLYVAMSRASNMVITN